jgi:hypothetical protein
MKTSDAKRGWFGVGVLSLTLVVAPNALAQSTQRDLGMLGSFHYALSSASSNVRLGNAVLIRVMSLSDSFGVAMQVMVGCDGSWMTRPFQLTILPRAEATFQILERKAKAGDDPVPLDVVDIHPTSESEAVYAKGVARHAAELCKTASKEVRNVLVPVGRSQADASGLQTSVALVSGTAEKRGGRLDIWVRHSLFKEEPSRGPGGAQIFLDGTPQTSRVLTGSYAMLRHSLDCTQRTSRVYEMAEYTAGIATPKTQSMSRDGASNSVIPNSIGEAILDSACKLY